MCVCVYVCCVLFGEFLGMRLQDLVVREIYIYKELASFFFLTVCHFALSSILEFLVVSIRTLVHSFVRVVIVTDVHAPHLWFLPTLFFLG